jgi:AcrR family transcriptional regulator
MTLVVKPRQQAKSKEIRAKVLQAAARSFVERGYHGTSLQDIATEAGIQKSALYYYFPSKELLCFEVFSRLGHHMVAGLEEICTLNVPGAEKLRRAIEYHIQRVAEQTNKLTVFLRESEYLSGVHLEEAQHIRDRYEACFRRIISEAVREGQLRPVDAKFASMAILGMCNWLYRWYKPGDKSPAEIASIFWNLVSEGLMLDVHKRTLEGAVSQPQDR